MIIIHCNINNNNNITQTISVESLSTNQINEMSTTRKQTKKKIIVQNTQKQKPTPQKTTNLKGQNKIKKSNQN